MIRVFHGDDSASYRRLLRELLAGDAEIALVGEGGTPEEVVAGVAGARPDVVLLDQLGGTALVDRIRAAAPGAAVVVLSGHDPGGGDRALAATADAYVVKAADATAVRAAIVRLAGR